MIRFESGWRRSASPTTSTGDKKERITESSANIPTQRLEWGPVDE
jgi:hypothetical protein